MKKWLITSLGNFFFLLDIKSAIIFHLLIIEIIEKK